MVQTIVYRTELIEDRAVLAEVDAQIAARAGRWPSMTRSRLAAVIDRIVVAADRDALRRRRKRVRDREVCISGFTEGTAQVEGTLAATDAAALDASLDALAATVCPADPRTKDQRRADALGALAVRVDRLACRCGTGCVAGKAAGPVVIHVVAEQATLDGSGQNPAVIVGSDVLLPAELVAELAASTKQVSLVPPIEPEPRYLPSARLADFVRARDLTCRAPGCDRPATLCDLDHTIPYGDGGPTHAGNIKALCRLHHLLKTFWGWRDTQLPDGTVIWRLPDGQTYVTTPGSALLFPTLSAPTHIEPTLRRASRCAGRAAMMPLRTTTRAQHRAHRIAAERHQNSQARTVHEKNCAATSYARPPDGEPPPF